uniref:Uncharacterized protein n=1 Tax=Arundo donax TaxID=35708 RepID=A0A0A8YVR7_ARUDO
MPMIGNSALDFPVPHADMLISIPLLSLLLVSESLKLELSFYKAQ